MDWFTACLFGFLACGALIGIVFCGSLIYCVVTDNYEPPVWTLVTALVLAMIAVLFLTAMVVIGRLDEDPLTLM